MKTALLSILLIFPFALCYPQQWEQLSGEPEGGGVTDIFLDEDSGDLYVATGSLNWPGGEDGGIRRSTDDGATWVNLFDAYTSRFVFRGPDGFLYASVWNYPADEGLYRSEDDGSTWDLLVSVPSGNNIFACAIREGSTDVLFAGTGQGIMRSMDNGVNWAYANSGLPANTLVRSLAVSPDGSTIAAGTVNGLYVSADDGDTWDKVMGDGQNEIISSVAFDSEPTKEGTPLLRLMAGSESGKFFVATSLTLFTVAALYATIAINSGITRIMVHRNPTSLVPLYLVSLYAALGGSFHYALAGFTMWQPFMNGLPSSPLISVFTSTLLVTTAVVVMYIAMYGNSKEMASGSEIYKATFDISTGVENRPFNTGGINLFQNIPNPFREHSRIDFELPQGGLTSLKVFDLSGHEVRELVSGMLGQGRHSIRLQGEGLRSGIYYYVLRTGQYSLTRKLVIQ